MIILFIFFPNFYIFEEKIYGIMVIGVFLGKINAQITPKYTTLMVISLRKYKQKIITKLRYSHDFYGKFLIFSKKEKPSERCDFSTFF